MARLLGAPPLRHVRSLIPIVVLCITGCAANIPPASVDLSEQIGVGIGKARDAHLSTLDAFYLRVQAENDTWVLNTFLPRAIAISKERLGGELTSGDVARIARNTIAFRDSLQAALQRNRDAAYRIVGDYYADLIAANAGVTGLLASAVDVNQATREAAKTGGEAIGVEIDTDAIQQAVSQFLEQADSTSVGLSGLATQLNTILNGPKKN